MIKEQLLVKLSKIQDLYKELLIKTIEILDKEPNYIFNALDGILLFWKKYESVIDIFLKYQYEEYSIYFYTAADYLDVDAFEHYPFLVQGKIHIMDDPLAKMCDITVKLQSEKYFNKEETLENIKKLIRNNITLLELPQQPIWLLPVRSNNRTEGLNEINQLAESIFLNLFEDISSISEYREKCQNISDIKKYLKGESLEGLLLYKDDSPDEIFESRMEKFIKYNSKSPYLKIFCESGDYSAVFLYSIIGYLIQAIDIYLTSEEYKIIPYIRSKISFYYYSILYHQQDDEGDILLYNYALYCHCFNMMIDLEKIKRIPLNKFLYVAKSLNQKIEFSDTIDFKKTKNIVSENLKDLYLGLA